MSSNSGTQRTENPSNGGGGRPNSIEGEKPKVVVIMGPTGSGKSKLAVDLGSHFPVEVINADSMQVYQGLDVLTNKVPLSEQNGQHSCIYLFALIFYFLCGFFII